MMRRKASEKRGLKLTIELVPSTAWRHSLYHYLKSRGREDLWRKLKKSLEEKEGKRCWICGAESRRLEAHEFWEYDMEGGVQRLAAIHLICPMCHKVKHVGFWLHTQDGRAALAKEGLSEDDVVKHFCRVNNCGEEVFFEHEKVAFAEWLIRSRIKWKQDFGEYSWLVEE